MGLLNPWALLGIVVLVIGAAFGGYRTGAKVTAASYEQAQRVALEKAVAEHNAQAEKDRRSAVDAEAKRQQARIKAQEKRYALQLEALANRKPECDWTTGPAGAVGLLNSLIDNANGSAPATSIVPDKVPADAASGGWLGRIGKSLGGGSGLKLR